MKHGRGVNMVYSDGNVRCHMDGIARWRPSLNISLNNIASFQRDEDSVLFLASGQTSAVNMAHYLFMAAPRVHRITIFICTIRELQSE